MAFQKASKKQLKARIALVGPAGSGKTFTALRIAKGLGTKIAVIDTERGSASKYAGEIIDFDVDEIDSFNPAAYVKRIQEAEAMGYEVLIIDSLSHAWMGEGGILSEVDRRGGKFDSWRHVTPMHNALIDAILSAKMHVIATMRSKTAYEIEKVEKNGRTTTEIRKLGLAPQQRDGMEFEFDIVGDMTDDHVLRVTKSRCSTLTDAAISKPGEDLGAKILAWLSDGEVAINKPTTDQRKKVGALLKEIGESADYIKVMMPNGGPHTDEDADLLIGMLETEASRRNDFDAATT